MRASSAIVDVHPEEIREARNEPETYVREVSYLDSRLCPHCNRGHLHRAHRESFLDFALSLVGIFPTVCGYCNAPGQRLEARRPAILLGTAAIALAWYIAHGVELAKSQPGPGSTVVVLKAHSHNPDAALSRQSVAPLDVR